MPQDFRSLSRNLLACSSLLVGTCAAVLAACSSYHERAQVAAAPPVYYAATSPGVAMEQPAPASREQYEHIDEHAFTSARSEPLSTFGIDVDTASYSNARRFLVEGSLPPADAVRVEEFLNYFDYDYAEPRGREPIAIHTELGPCPWNPEHLMLHVGLRARSMSDERVPPRNLVFLVDVSGSMQDANKLPLLKEAFAALADDLREQDRVSMVAYAGHEGLVLPPTSGAHKREILGALERLEAGGSTNGGAGIELAYAMAQKTFVQGGINRVILATDGDFNVGVTSQGELVQLIERQREHGVFLTVLGFGSGNLQDHTMESLADHGNGNYAYLDSRREAEKVLVREAASTLVTVAKDVKVQVELNPAHVAAYRLVGYENRALRSQDFANDRRDAGDMGANDAVTALYEIVPAQGHEQELSLRYQEPRALSAQAESGELATVSVRYKEPQAGSSELLSARVTAQPVEIARTSSTFRFAAAVAGFGMLLRRSPHAGSASYADMRALASASLAQDATGDRRELVQLIDRAASLSRD